MTRNVTLDCARKKKEGETNGRGNNYCSNLRNVNYYMCDNVTLIIICAINRNKKQ